MLTDFKLPNFDKDLWYFGRQEDRMGGIFQIGLTNAKCHFCDAPAEVLTYLPLPPPHILQEAHVEGKENSQQKITPLSGDNN